LQIPTIFRKYGRITCQLLNVHGVNSVRQTDMHMAELLLPEPILSRFKLLLKSWKDLSHQVLIKFQQN